MATLSLEEALGSPAPVGKKRIGLEEALGAKPAQPPEVPDKPSLLGQMAKDTASNAGVLADTVLSIPGQALGVGANLGARIVGTVAGEPRKQVEESAQRIGQSVAEPFSNPIRKLMALYGHEDTYDQGQVAAVLNKATGLISQGGKKVEQLTHGVLTKADVEDIVNTTFLGAGARVTQAMVAKPLEKFSDWAATRGDRVKAAEKAQGFVSPETARQLYDEYKAAGGTEQLDVPKSKAALDADINATNKAYELMQKGASVREVQAARAKNPLVGKKLDEFMARRQEVRQGPMAETLQGEVLPPEQMGMLPDQGAGSGVVVDQPLPTSRQIAGPRGEADPRLLAAIAAGGTAALLAYKDQDLAAAGLGGALMLATGGKAADALRAPASALLTALKDSRYTLKTFERLPQNRTEFPKQMVEEQLKRQDVTGPEKELVQGILKDTPGDTIKATELADKFKLATGDFELAAKETGQYADYGLEQVRPQDTNEFGKPTGPTAAEETSTTTLYRLPQKVSSANHFNDPNLFGWTRSFKEDGVRHVVEVQSELAQHTKALDPSKKTELLRDLKEAEDASIKADEAFRKIDDTPLRGENDWVIAKRAQRAAQLKVNELRVALEAGAAGELVGPILKNPHRRLIREELAQAAKQGESVVRFADADTVAKVEGWPDGRANTEARLTDLERQLSHAQLGRIGRSGLRPEEAASRIQQLIDHEKSILRELPEGRSFSAAHQSIYDRYAGDYTRYLKSLGGKPVTDAQGHGWIEVPTERFRGPTHMYGKADPKLLAAMAAAGAGAVLMGSMSEDQLRGALQGSALGLILALSAPHLVKGGDMALGGMMTRVQNISPVLAHRLQQYEFNIKTRPHAFIEPTNAFFEALHKLPGEEGAALSRAISTNDAGRIRAGLIKTGDLSLIRGWNTIRKNLDTIGEEARRLGLIKGMLQDYFPRIVTDRAGLLESLGKEAKSTLEERLLDANIQALKKTGDGLTPVQEAHVINQVLRGFTGKDFRPGFTKGRTIGEITPDLQQFYASPVEAYHTYVRTMVTAIEKAKLFGKGLVKSPEGFVDTDTSVGNLIRQTVKEGKLSQAAQEELTSMFQSRFGPGERGASSVIQFLKNATYAGLLANVISAAKQLTDIVPTVITQGTLPTVRAVVQKVTGRAPSSAFDMGLTESISAEFASQLDSAKFLNKSMKYAGFTKVDLLMKDINLNASLIKGRMLAKTEKGIAQLAQKYQAGFGEEFPALIRDLQKGDFNSENVRLYQFSELAKIQPISKSELPQLYHNMPNGRAAYMLNSFTLKQLDLVRNEAYGRMKAGNVVGGATWLVKYGVMMGLAGATAQQITDWMLGKDTELDASLIGLNILKTFGWSNYQLDHLKDKPATTIAGLAVPPFEVFDTLWQTGKIKADGTRDWRGVQYLPLIGKPLYYHAFGGKEEYNAKQEKKKMDKLLKGE